MNKPWGKLLDRLTVMQDFKAEWPDYWRGFWDATRALRHDATPALGQVADKREYLNGYTKGDLAYKAARMHAITNPKPRKKP